MGFHWQFGVVQQGSSSPLAVSISSNNSPTTVTCGAAAAGPGGNATSTAGEIDYTATPSGGTAPYTYAWVLSEVLDPDNVLNLTAAGAGQGTTNAQQYDTGRINGTFPAGPPPQNGLYRVVCTVSDSASGSVAAQDDFVVDPLN